MKRIWASAIRSAKKMCLGKPANARVCDSFEETCFQVTVHVKCDKDMTDLFENNQWRGQTIAGKYGTRCKGFCGKTKIVNCNDTQDKS